MLAPPPDLPVRRRVPVRRRLRGVAAWQLPSLVLAAAVWAALALSPVSAGRVTGAGLGLLLILAATVAGLALDRARVGVTWRIAVPALDLVGTVIVNDHAQRLLPSAMLLAAIPVTWLGFEFGRRGVAVATLGVLGVAVLPYLDDTAPRQALGLVNVVLIVLVGVVVAIVASVVGRVLRESRARLVSDARRLSQELDTLNAVMLTVDAGIVVLIDGEAPRRNDEAIRFARRAGNLATPLEGAPHVYERRRGHPGGARTPAAGPGPRRGVLPRPHALPRTPGDQVAVVTSCHQIVADDGTHLGTVLVAFDATTLVDAVRLREDFLTTVSHELRTPLTSIIASLEMLHGEIDDVRRGTSDPDAAERLLSIASRNAGTLFGRINQLLSAAPGAVEVMTPRSTDVGRLTRDAMTKHREHAADRGVVLDLDTRDGVVVELDPVAFERVVDNLVSNAIKYTLAGGRVGVSLSHREDRLHLRVTDTGIGMNRDEQRQVFDRFYRSTAVIDAAVPGIGIGLTVTKRLVRLLGGQISVSSERGRGTTMEVVLPAGTQVGV